MADVFHGANSKQQLPIPLQLAIVLNRLGGDGTLFSIASHFGVGDGGTIKKICDRVFQAILNLSAKYLSWPSVEERTEICDMTRLELSGCVGYLDGSEIRLREAPKCHKEDYFSRKRQYSMKLQAICDYRKRIRYITVGYPGSVHDSRIFNECALGREPTKFLSPKEWVAADSAYKLSAYIITPYRTNSRENCSQAQKTNFNKYFSKFRVRIEHCFGLLKERFGSLKNMPLGLDTAESHNFFCKWIRVCCILHNILLCDDDDDYFAQTEIGDENQYPNYSNNDRSVSSEGEMIRRYIYENCIAN